MTYEYVCEACGHQWEAEQSIKDRALDKCVSCGAAKAKRLVSGGTGFLLKGGGWYADLYGSPGASKASDDKNAKAATPASKSDSSESKTSSDSKPSGDGKAASSGDTSSGSSSSSSSSGSSSSGSTSSATPSAKAS
jgi:putative FmdB family regulatory protein